MGMKIGEISSSICRFVRTCFPRLHTSSRAQSSCPFNDQQHTFQFPRELSVLQRLKNNNRTRIPKSAIRLPLSHSVSLISVIHRAIAQSVCRRLPKTVTRVQFQVTSSGIHNGQSYTGGSSLSTSVFPTSSHSTM
jgi:hypothetical protein